MTEALGTIRDQTDAIAKGIAHRSDIKHLSRLYFNRAGMFGDSNDHDRAVEDYLEALRLEQSLLPLNKRFITDIRTMIAFEFKLQGKGELAAYWSLSAINGQQDNPQAQFAFGLICFQCEFFHLAIEAFHKVLQLEPGHDAAILKLGESLQEVNRMREAIEFLTQYTDKHPDDAKGWYEMGRATQLSLDLRNRREEAKTFYQRAVGANPPPELRALVERRLLDIESAIKE